tara:strand:+ start:175 stop:681 length:507 start_codon:yes stop_codon:yes gene_type:complete
MGKKSRKVLHCKILLSITNQFYNNVIQNIKDSNFGKIIAEKTNNNAKVIDETWEIDHGVLGSINQTINSGGILGVGMAIFGGPLTLVAGASWTNATIIYTIDVDLYNLTKDRTNIFVAQVSKLFKKKRKKTIMDTIRTQIKDGFEDAIESSAGILSSAVVTVKSVDIY